VEARLGEVAAPTLVVWGSEDPWLAVSQGSELARRIPGARLEVVAGAGHLVPLDAPAELARLIDGHLVPSG
jgi:pimeloyl-ACP methyl ester carboxylesterase